MRPSKPSKLQSVVAGFLVAATVGFIFAGPGSVALGQTTTPAAAPTINFSSGTTVCADLYKSIQDGASSMIAACSKAGNMTDFKPASANDRKKCIANLLHCQKDEGKTIQDSGDTNADDCAALTQFGCADLGGTVEDLTKQKTEAQKARQDLVKQKDDNAKAAMDQVNQAQQKSDQLNDKMAQDDQQWQQSRIKAQRDLQTALDGMDDQRAKTVKEAQQKYDEISANYVKLRDQLRRKGSTASNLKLSWDVQCRAAANQSGKDAEKAMDDRIAAESKTLTNYTLSTAAGRNNRLLKLKRIKILDAYNTMLTRCLQGVDGPGVQIKLNLDNAQKDVLDSGAQANDQSAVMENQRKEVLADMQSLASSLGKKTQQLISNTTQDLATLDQNHMTNQNRMAMQAMQAQQQAGQQQQVQAAQAQNIDNDLKDARADEVIASTKLKCGAVTMSKDDVKDAKTDRKVAMPTLKLVDSQCASFEADCVNATPKNPTPPLCKDVAKARQIDGKNDLAAGKVSNSSEAAQYQNWKGAAPLTPSVGSSYTSPAAPTTGAPPIFTQQGTAPAPAAPPANGSNQSGGPLQ